MKSAAAIIREDIGSKAFEMDVYATSEVAFNDVSVVPETLETFTDNVMINKRKKGNMAAKTRNCFKSPYCHLVLNLQTIYSYILEYIYEKAISPINMNDRSSRRVHGDF